MDGQRNIFDVFFDIAEAKGMTPAQEYYLVTGKKTYWQDSQGKPYRWYAESVDKWTDR